MFEAPGLPEPSAVTSTPRRRATSARARERPEQVGHGHQECHLDAGVHRRVHSTAPRVPALRRSTARPGVPFRARNSPGEVGLAVASTSANSPRWRPRRGPDAHLRLRMRQVWRRVRALPVVLRGAAEEAPGLRRQGRQGVPAGRDRAQGLGLLQERQPRAVQALERQRGQVGVVRLGPDNGSRDGSKSEGTKSDSSSKGSDANGSDERVGSSSVGRRRQKKSDSSTSSAKPVVVTTPPSLPARPPTSLSSPERPRRCRAPSREGPVMPRRSPRALALWGAACGRRGRHRRGRRRRPRRAAPSRRRPRPGGRRRRRHPRPPRRPPWCATGDLATRPCHRSQLPPGVLTDRTAVVGRVVAVPVLDGAYVAAPQPSRRGGAPVSTVWSRAACGRCGSWSPTRSTPRPGAAVDVLATFDPQHRGDRRRRHDRRRRRGRDRARHRPTRRQRHAGAAGAAGVTLLVDPDQAACARRRAGQRRGHARARPARGRDAHP